MAAKSETIFSNELSEDEYTEDDVGFNMFTIESDSEDDTKVEPSRGNEPGSELQTETIFHNCIGFKSKVPVGIDQGSASDTKEVTCETLPEQVKVDENHSLNDEDTSNNDIEENTHHIGYTDFGDKQKLEAVHVLCDKNEDQMGGSLAPETQQQSGVTQQEKEEDFCCICRDEHNDPKVLPKCSHSFCTDCIDEYFKIKPQCPMCFTAYGVITGNMPQGDMSDYVSTKVKLSGYESIGTIVIHYSFADGTQTEEHPHPGKHYYGTSRTAYLPDNEEGRKVLRLLKASFKRRLTFTVGHSRTTGMDDCVTWNDIHHKTCPCGGQQNFGYPDDTYLQRVQEELAAKGVTEESLKEFPDHV
ncbi:E3 ubiquitin-protein ligase DTX3L-like [Dreissena polymorpha]|uniref:E3 ubiquitin-protein ligase n=1 Tax=Dreissena polymorpha TaxID=45954 RepID=A0A9D4IZ00_DREPO|nr:E3 ubiquitin-protein ligase DTX3L-like [Dreissena polymorpha]XP_052229095.1 E3 ubiquitin-protein ligase DTX3L-like [Dreissena polymorpha]KAH3789919.1 hypothetical protein DPMN_168111 [Dreissena polymorpha]